MTEQPVYVGMLPGMAEWWLDHLDIPPAVVIRCGYRDPNVRQRQCRNSIGEIKASGGAILAMSRNEYPEVSADWEPLAAVTPEELAAEMAERDSQVLRYTGVPGEGGIVYKRTSLPREVAPVERMTYYVCRIHGEVEVDTADLAAFAHAAVADTPSARTTQTYQAHPDIY
jgi:hypothetical protein